MKRSTRDPATMQAPLAHWLATRLPPGADPAVSGLRGTEVNGMSSTTLLFDAIWRTGDGPVEERLVARLAPGGDDVPVFPQYDLPAQYGLMRAVGEHTAAPVPQALWCEPDTSVLGVPFLVMRRVDGLVPPDVMPYTFGGNWLAEASDSQRDELQRSTVAALAAVHALPDPTRLGFLQRPGETHRDPRGHPSQDGGALRRHVEHTRDWYEFCAADGVRSPLVEAGFAWLDAHWPSDEPATVLSWGDARIGNVLYRDFHPVALLDWEMAGLGPRELDVAWLAYSHLVFQDLAESLGEPGLPSFLRLDDVAAGYEQASGVRLRDLGFYLAYAAVQWGIVLLRTGVRMVRFGEREMPADPEAFLFHRAHLQQLVADEAWPHSLGV